MIRGWEGRCIAHLDMDAFYASVELLARPELRGQPLVIGGRRAKAGEPVIGRLKDYRGRGVVTTATYEARAFGVRSGMGIMKAAQLAPEALLLPVDFEAYGRASRAFKAAVAAIAPRIEDRGIDEIYLDLTEVDGEVREVGLALKDAVKAATGLTCSIGITPNKLLSKIASELDKPDGLTLLRAEEVPTRIWPLPVKVVNGVGPKAWERLQAMGLDTLGKVAAADPEELVRAFGRSFGAWLFEAAHGRDERPLVTEREPKSISRETTFERDLHPRADREALTRILTTLCEGLEKDLARKGLQAKAVGIKLRYDDFRTVTRDTTLAAPIHDAEALRDAARSCLKRVDLDRRLRLLGVRAGHLLPEGTEAVAETVEAFAQPKLFETESGD